MIAFLYGFRCFKSNPAGDRHTCTSLLETVIIRNPPSMYRSRQNTEKLHRAIQVGQLAEVKRLIQDGANMDYVLGMRGTALCAAIVARSYETALCLLEAGCDVNARDFDGEPPLLLALRKGLPMQGTHPTSRANHMNIVPLLINHPDCDLNKIDPLTKSSALHCATTECRPQVVRWLMESKSKTELNVNIKDSDGNTPLHVAVLKNNVEIVKLLVDHSNALCTVNTGENTFLGFPINFEGVSPIHLCARNGNIELLVILLERLSNEGKPNGGLPCGESAEKVNGHNTNSSESVLSLNLNAETTYEKETCMHFACRHGHIDLVKVLLDWDASVDNTDIMGNTPLLLSLTNCKQKVVVNDNDVELARLLLEHGANPNSKSSHGTGYWNLDSTPLIIAATNGNLELAELLVEHGADVNLAGRAGRTPICFALLNNSISVAMYLLKNCPGIDVTLSGYDNTTSIQSLARLKPKTDYAVVKELAGLIFGLGDYCRPDLCEDVQVALQTAVENENDKVLDVILTTSERGIQCLDIPTQETMMVQAVGEGLIDMVQVLLSHGVDIDKTVDKSCLHANSYVSTALKESHLQLVKYLVGNGADVKQLAVQAAQMEVKHEVAKIDRAVHMFNNGPGDNDNNVQHGNGVDNEDSDDETDSDDDVLDNTDGDDSDDDGDGLSGHKDIRALLIHVNTNPKSLELSCLIGIRKHFINYKLDFRRVDTLTDLPKRLVSKLRYK